MENETEIQRISHHKKRKVYITTDCVSEVPDSMLEKYSIGLMYLYIKTDSGRFADTWEISSDNISQFMTETTSNAIADSVSVEEYENFFADALTQAEQADDSGSGAGRMDGAWKRFIHRYLRHNKKINDDVIFISHVACSVEQQKSIQREVLRCIPFKRVIMQRASVTTACSSGIGTFGFAYFVNASIDDLSDR